MNYEPAKRTYRQTARAEAAEATARRILDAFAAAARERWFDEVRLEDVARDAGFSVQTVIRRFGGKEGLLEGLAEHIGREVRRRRSVPAGDVAAAAAALSEDYDASGDMVMRLLSQEERYPAIRAVADIGRAEHRHWVSDIFSEALAASARRERLLDALVVATDLYVWKLYRRDMRRSAADYRAAVEAMARAALNHA
jgi:AcrR family transcriptional regulator